MNYVQFHIGDWMSSTSLLSATERGVYMDLLCIYYSTERPLMRSQCDRIARAYAKEERDALEYVLQEYFVEENGYFYHRRCEQEIEACRDKSEKARLSAKARWQKGKQEVSAPKTAPQNNASQSERNADAMRSHVRTQCDGNANQEPITNNHKRVNLYVGRGGAGGDPTPPPKASTSSTPTATDFESLCDEAEKLSPAQLTAEPLPAEGSLTPSTPAKEHKPRQPLVPYPETLPDEWASAARLARPDIDPMRVHEKLKARYMPTTQRKTIGNWRKIFMDWIGREYARNSTNDLNHGTRTGAAQSFAKIDYSAGIDPETGRIMRQEEWDRRCREAQHAVN